MCEMIIHGSIKREGALQGKSAVPELPNAPAGGCCCCCEPKPVPAALLLPLPKALLRFAGLPIAPWPVEKLLEG